MRDIARRHCLYLRKCSTAAFQVSAALKSITVLPLWIRDALIHNAVTKIELDTERARLMLETKARTIAGLILLSLNCLLVESSVKSEQLPTRTYTTADGLPRDVVSQIRQDSRGFLWFCTSDGLSRFDGYTFVNYTTEDGLPHRRVHDILETREGSYWVATDDGLARFNPKGQRGTLSSPGDSRSAIHNSSGPMFVTYRLENEATGGAFFVLYEDEQKTVWCGTSEGLYRLEERSGDVRFNRVELSADKGRLPVISIIRDRRGALWVGADDRNGLFRMVSDEKGITIQVTPMGEPAPSWCVRKSLDKIELHASADVDFDFMVNGVRRASKDHKPIVENTIFVPRSADDNRFKNLNPEAVRRLKATRILNEDGSVNMETVQKLDAYKRLHDQK